MRSLTDVLQLLVHSLQRHFVCVGLSKEGGFGVLCACVSCDVVCGTGGERGQSCWRPDRNHRRSETGASPTSLAIDPIRCACCYAPACGSTRLPLAPRQPGGQAAHMPGAPSSSAACCVPDDRRACRRRSTVNALGHQRTRPPRPSRWLHRPKPTHGRRGRRKRGATTTTRDGRRRRRRREGEPSRLTTEAP